MCEALKTAIYAQCLLELVGVKPVPRYTDDHNDIVTCFDSGSAAALTGFCAGIQHNSPVDSFADPDAREERALSSFLWKLIRSRPKYTLLQNLKRRYRRI